MSVEVPEFEKGQVGYQISVAELKRMVPCAQWKFSKSDQLLYFARRFSADATRDLTGSLQAKSRGVPCWQGIPRWRKGARHGGNLS